ncbi:MAG: DsbA family protein [Myxococcaceae bacterium]
MRHLRRALLALVWTAGAASAAAPTEAPPLDFSGLSESARQEVAEAMGEEYCGCGAPHTLATCLQTHTGCRHSRREVQLAAILAERGATAAELGVVLARYNLSFQQPRAKLPVDGRMCQGDAQAKVTLVEFADFECPICGVSRPVLEKFAQEHAGQVRLCYLPFPLAQHPNSMPAGQAALFARNHGKFWAVHDGLFENQTRLSPDVIREVVVKAGLSASAWDQALAQEEFRAELENFRDAGAAAGVQGTPTVYVNGRKVDFLPQADLLQLTLEDELDFQAHQGSWAVDAPK